MEKVTISQFRRDAEAIIRKVRQGKPLLLTYRGRTVMRLEPIQDRVIDKNDPLYLISRLAVADERSLKNEEVDEIVYTG